MNFTNTMRPRGDITMRVTRAPGMQQRELSLGEILALGLPSLRETREVNLWRLANIPNLLRGLWMVMLARLLSIPHFYGVVHMVIRRATGEVVNLGLASLRVVTNAGVNYIAADIAGGANDSDLFKYHGFGTGTTNEAAGDTALVTELTTEYATDNIRPTGSQSATTNVYTTVGTLSPDASVAITEHGIFTQAATGGGTLLDRSKFAAVNLVSGDSLQVTYALTLSAGG